MFMESYKFSRLVMHLNSCSMDLGRDTLNWKTWPVGIQNSVAVCKRGSSTLIWWMWEMQERPRGMRVSLKLRLSMLTHKETSSGENSDIRNLKDCLLGLKYILWGFRDILRLFYNKKCRLGLLPTTISAHSQSMGMHSPSMGVYTWKYVCAWFLGFLDSFSFLECGSYNKDPF